MAQPISSSEKCCENCGKVLFGRTDKRFCNDTCRNTFNRQKTLREQQRDHDNLPEILKIIKHNYKLLKEFTGPIEKDLQMYGEVKPLTEQGFNPKYFTSIMMDGNEIWRFCFERGWLITGNYINVRDEPEQADLK